MRPVRRARAGGRRTRSMRSIPVLVVLATATIDRADDGRRPIASAAPARGRSPGRAAGAGSSAPRSRCPSIRRRPEADRRSGGGPYPGTRASTSASAPWCSTPVVPACPRSISCASVASTLPGARPRPVRPRRLRPARRGRERPDRMPRQRSTRCSTSRSSRRPTAQRAALVAATTALAQQCPRPATVTCSRTCPPPTPSTTSSVCGSRWASRTLSFVGYSYGTFLGASYAEAYPDRVRAFVLDGPVDPSMSARAVTLAQARGLRTRARRLPRRLLGRSRLRVPSRRRTPAGAYDALRAKAATAPLATDDADGRTLNQTRFDAAVLQQLYLGRSRLVGPRRRARRRRTTVTRRRCSRGPTRSWAGATAAGDDHVLESFWAVTLSRRPRGRGGGRRRRPRAACGGGGAPPGRVRGEQQPAVLGVAGAAVAADGSAHRRRRAADPRGRHHRGPRHTAGPGARRWRARSDAVGCSWPRASSTPASTTATPASTTSSRGTSSTASCHAPVPAADHSAP